MRESLSRCLNFGVSRPVMTLVVSFAMLVVSGFGLSRLQIESDYKIYFDDEHQSLVI